MGGHFMPSAAAAPLSQSRGSYVNIHPLLFTYPAGGSDVAVHVYDSDFTPTFRLFRAGQDNDDFEAVLHARPGLRNIRSAPPPPGPCPCRRMASPRSWTAVDADMDVTAVGKNGVEDKGN